MHKKVEVFGSASKTARHAADIVAALAPPPRHDALAGAASSVLPAEAPPSAGKSAMALAPGVAGAAIGAVYWKKHRVLGALAGHALAGNAMPLYKSWHSESERNTILCRMATDGTGIAGALLLRKHGMLVSALGWVAGIAVGVAASSFVSGTPMNDGFRKLKKDLTE